MKCPKCNADMKEGWISEQGQGIRPVQWTEGAPEPSWLTGNKIPSKDKVWNVVTFCCANCGYLESYARKP